MSSAAFAIITLLTIMAALAAALLPRLMRAALSLALTFVGIAAFYFFLGAEFVGLVQVFVYVGAVAVLIVFTILLTRRDSHASDPFNWSGVVIAGAVLTGLIWVIVKTPLLSLTMPRAQALNVAEIGRILLNQYVWPLQCVGLLLTAALIGALILVIHEER